MIKALRLEKRPVGRRKGEGMNKTKIEWCDYTSNPVKGLCPVACSYCYARAMYKRFKWNEAIRTSPRELHQWHTAQPGSTVFVGSTIELFGPWVPSVWLRIILNCVRLHPDKTFIFLTKRPWELPKWNSWPANTRVGVTVDGTRDNALDDFASVDCWTKFISFEPLLNECSQYLHLIHNLGIAWVIIGAQTGAGSKPPRLAWVQEIVEAADQAKIPVFLKENLLRLFPILERRQEWP